MADDDWNPQDAYASLCEDGRLGRLAMPYGVEQQGRWLTKMVPLIGMDVDLASLPVFYFGDVPQTIYDVDMEPVAAAMTQRTYHLPYPSCAILMSAPPGHQGIAERLRDVRHNYVIIMSEDDTGIEAMSFFRSIADRWALQTVLVRVEFGSANYILTRHPAWETFKNPEFEREQLEVSLCNRVSVTLEQLHRLTTGSGTAEWVEPGNRTRQANAMRARKGLPPVPGVRMIDLSKPRPATVQAGGEGSGTPHRPHYVRGSWHTRKKSGKTYWVGPRAVHGGTGDAPPWYHIKAPPPS